MLAYLFAGVLEGTLENALEHTSLYRRFPKLDGLTLASACEPKDFWSDCVQGQNAMSKPSLRHRPRHTPDGAGGLILRENDAVVFSNDPASGQTVVAHAGQHNPEHA